MSGVSNLFQRLWTSGTPSYSALKLSEILEGLGASLHGFSGRHTMGISTEFLSKQWPIIKPLLTEVLLSPTFPADELQTERELVEREILTEKDTAGQLCHMNFLEALYGDHPYGRSSLGTVDTVSKLDQKTLKQFYQRFIHRDGLVVSTVGNFAKDSWIEELKDLCGRLPLAGAAPAPLMDIPAPRELRIVTTKKQPLFQAHIMVGFLGASLKDSERHALKLLSSCLAGQGGRLFLELRDRQSLAYSVSPISSDSPEKGLFAFYIGCAPEKLEKSLIGIRTEIEKISAAPMGRAELDRAKQYWVGRFELDMQRIASQAMLFGLDETYGMGHDYSLKTPDIVRSLTAKDVQAAAEKYLQLEAATISIVHPEELSRERVEAAWRGTTEVKGKTRNNTSGTAREAGAGR